MPYDNIVTRAKSAPLVTEEVSRSMLGKGGGVQANSAVLQLFRHVPVAHGQVRFPILSALPLAYWVAGDTGLKQTTEEAWANKFLNIEELACIVPIPENVIADTPEFDIWGNIQPEVEEAIGRALDAAVLFGINAPATFPTNVSAAALAAGNTVTEGAAVAAGGISDDIDQLIGLIEADGFDPTGIVAARSLRGKLRRARNTLGDRLSNVNGNLTEYDGLAIATPARGLFPTGGAGANLRALVGDFSDFVVGVRQDISLKLLDQAVIQDGTGAIIYNLPQQDMVALRVTFRVGWQVSNRINYDQPVEANRYPAGRLVF